MPPRMPVTAAGCSTRPSSSRRRRHQRDDHLHDRAGPEAEQERGQRGVVGRRADPGAEHRGRAREQAQRDQPAERGARLRERRDDRQPLGRVVDREPDDQERAQRERAGGVRGADRHALAEVVQPDPDRDQRRGTCRRAPAQPGRDAAQHQVGDDRADEHERRAAERLRALAGQLEALERRVDGQEREQPDGQRHQPAQPHGRHAPQPRQPQHAERDRDHADVDPEQRHQPEEPDVGRGRLDRDRDLVHDRPAGGGHQRDLVGLALDPRLRDAHGRGLEPADRVIGARELRERVVDHDLRDRHRVRPVVAHRQLDRAGREHRPLDRELLGGRPAPLAEARRVERHEQRDPAHDQQQRDQPEQPYRDPQRLLRRRSHHVTSKKPCQPSSVNSDWCAWNMYLPGYAKRHSRIPRCPWQSITVSVSSDGVLPVPVGK